jgi:hypothetical protein
MFLVAASLSGFKPLSALQRSLQIAIIATLALFWTFPLYFVCVAWHCLYLMCPVLAVFAFSVLLTARYVDNRKQVEVEYLTA